MSVETFCLLVQGSVSNPCKSRMGKRILEKTTDITNELRAGFQQVYSSLDQRTLYLSEENTPRHNAMSSQLTQVESANDAGLQNVSIRLDENARLSVLNTQKLDVAAQGHIRVESTVSEFTGKVCSTLRQVHEGPHQIQNCHITYGPTSRRARKILDNPTDRENIHEAVVYWSWKSYHLPLGCLWFDMRTSRKTQHVDRKLVCSLMHTEVSVTFAAPVWLSKHVIRLMASVEHKSNTREWALGASLKPMILNCDPVFLQAVTNCDVEGVRRSFQLGTARPNDYVVIGSLPPLPWFKVSPSVRPSCFA